MTYKTTQFRQNIYSILDSIIESGKPVTVERKGHKLKITPEKNGSIWDSLDPHDQVITCTDEELLRSPSEWDKESELE